MPSRPWGSLGLRPRDPQGHGRHYFFTNNALAGILIVVLYKYQLRTFPLPLRSARALLTLLRARAILSTSPLCTRHRLLSTSLRRSSTAASRSLQEDRRVERSKGTLGKRGKRAWLRHIRGDVKIPHSRMTKTCLETLVTCL